MTEATRKVYFDGIIDKFFKTLGECCICDCPIEEPAKLDNCEHTICVDCYEHLQKKECPLCRSSYNSYIPLHEFRERISNVVLCDCETFQGRIISEKHLYSATFRELMTILNSINNVEIEILHQIYEQAVFTTTSEFFDIVNTISMGYHSNSKPTELQHYMFSNLVATNAVALSKTRNFITHTENAILAQLKDVCENQRELVPGHLLKVLAFCEDTVFIPALLKVILDYSPSKVATIFNYLFELKHNGPRETMELLEYHKDQDLDHIHAFFTHYYNNQWLNHPHLKDECVMEMKTEQGSVVAVFGNEYDISGRLCYSGWYRKKMYHGLGKLFNNDDKTYYEGTFMDGLKEGEFVKMNERYKQQIDTFMNDKRSGISIEFYSDGKRRAVYQYKNDKKNGLGYELMGSGCLRSRFNYQDDIPVEDGYVYNSPCTCRICRNGEIVQEELLYHPNLECAFEYKNPVYTEAYYHSEPQTFIKQNMDHQFFYLRFLENPSAEFFINTEILGLLDKWTKEYKDPYKFISGKESESLILMSDKSETIDFKELWNILQQLNRLSMVCIKNFKLNNVVFTDAMRPIVMTTVVFYNCQFDEFVFDKPFLNNARTIRFENCVNLSRIVIKNNTMENVKEFVVADCPDLREVLIEDNNCLNVDSFSVCQGLDNLQRIHLGRKVFLMCTQLQLSHLPKLQSLKFGEYACTSGCVFALSNCDELKEIHFGDKTFANGTTMKITNVPVLQQITMGKGCFKRIEEVQVQEAPSLTTFTCAQPLRKKPTIQYTDSNPEGLPSIQSWFKK